MARVLDDAARAKLLSSMIDRYDLDDDSGSNYPTTSTVPVPRDAPAGSENPNREDEQDMINQKMGRDPSNMQNMSRQQMVSVPASLAHAGMAALMSQASGGRAMGADGAGGQSIQVAQNDGVDPEMLRKMQFLSGPTDTSTDGGWQNDRMYHGSRAGAQREGAVAGGMANSNKKVKRPE